jgi:ribose/xylose/arabinose/galactoside ABC-type transport system permease subunit
MPLVTHSMQSTPSSGPASEPPDRILFHLIWEAALLLLVLILLAVCLAVGFRFANLLSSMAGYGLVAFAFSLSVRAAVPNLAVTGAAGVAAAVTGLLGGWSGAALGLLVLLVIGVVLAALSLLPVPVWATTLVVGLGLSALVVSLLGGQSHIVTPSAAVPVILVVLGVLASIGFGIACVFWPVRGLVGGYRTATGVAPTWRARGIAAAAILVSTVAAGFGGIAQTFWLGVADPNSTPNLLYVLAAVLIGGASLYGRRVGVAGTFLGVLLVGLIGTICAIAGVPSSVSLVIVAVIAVVGLGGSALLDRLGAGRPAARTLAGTTGEAA